jgi:hypothetical protein
MEQQDASQGLPKAPFNWDKLTALMAVLIGACALGVSLYTAFLQRSQVEAQTWPFLQLWHSNSDFSYSLSNRGVGPARIVDAKVFVDDAQVANFEQAFEKLSGRKPVDTRQSFFSRRVLAANEDVQMIQFKSQADYDVFQANGKRLSFQICYCSVLDDCYLLDERARSESEYIRPVASCPVNGIGTFR